MKRSTEHSAKPRSFSLHWGSGVIAEEVQIVTPYHRPTIQLLKFTDGPAKGSEEVRFCVYDHRGRFQRMPCIIDAKDLAKLRGELAKAPRLRQLISRLVDKESKCKKSGLCRDK
jgi:hypothetical protein